MIIEHKKNTLFYLAVPMLDSAAPETFKTGLTVADAAYSKDGAGVWSTLAIADAFAEIGTTGMYQIDLTALEMNHDMVLIKMTSAGAADSFVIFRMGTNNVDDVKTDTAAILVDTAVIGAAGAGLTDLGGMSTTMKAQVNTEAKDVLVTDTVAEQTTGAPAATQTIAKMLSYLYMNWRNGNIATATQRSLKNDAGTIIAKATMSDNATTFDKGKMVTGP